VDLQRRSGRAWACFGLCSVGAPHIRAADLPLCGISVTVKDNFDVAGLPTTAACSAGRTDRPTD